MSLNITEVASRTIVMSCLAWLISGVWTHFFNHKDQTSFILVLILCSILFTVTVIYVNRMQLKIPIFICLIVSAAIFFCGNYYYQQKEAQLIHNLRYISQNSHQKSVTISINRMMYTTKHKNVYDVDINDFHLPARLTTAHNYHQNDTVLMNAEILIKNNKKRILINVNETLVLSIKPSVLGKYSASLQNYFSKLYQKYLRDETLGIVEGIVLGMQTHIPVWFNNLFRDVGISHIIVLSGYNIVLVYEGLFLLCGRFISKNPITIISLLFSYLLVMIAGNTQASQRAYQSIMIHEGLRIFKILPSIEKTILYIITYVVITTQEILLSHVGLLLSCGATLGIVLSMRLFNYIKRTYGFSKFITYVGSIATTTLGAWCGTLPIVIAFFGVATPSGMIMSIIVMPLVFLYTTCGIGFLFLAMFEQYIPLIHHVLTLIAWCFTKATNIIMLVAVSVRYHIESISVNEHQSLIVAVSIAVIFCILGATTLPYVLFKSRFNNSKV